ncbi:Peptidyl-prolyl_cis-trans isomerase [Hexamita inflata]|uniref:Peptidyl-prolyl cis-trans isomerase n=1 Tax=Hexamita inflata TaxID=28002 RepID=A0AA86RC30_9EUKA|nr:Peptidyl-prolyl cis-trans isomerase [Hexamita inflata]
MLFSCVLAQQYMKVTHHAVLDIFNLNQPIGQIRIALFGADYPNIVSNFMQLANGPENRQYAYCPFHSIIKNFMIQTGDFQRGDGRGKAILIQEPLETIQRNMPTTYSVAQTDGSQFYIVTGKQNHMKDPVFGHVIEGHYLVNWINEQNVDILNRPLSRIDIGGSRAEPVQEYILRIND